MKAKYIALCPSCSARLPMNDSHMEIADGSIRCGRCNTGFYAPDHLLRGFYSPAAKPRQASSFSMPFDLAETEEQPAQQQSQTTEAEQQWQDEPLRSGVQTSLPEETAMPEDSVDDEQSIDREHIISTPDKRAVDIPRRRVRKNNGEPRSKKWLWIPAIILVVLALLFQLFVVNASSWGKNPMLRGIYSQLCATSLCELPVDIKPVSLNIEIAGYRKLENGNYEIRGLLTNWAYYDQPMPVIRVSFVDLSETVRYSKEFAPEDYVPGYQQQSSTLKAEQQFNFTVTIQDLEKEAKHLFPRMELVSY